jgi:hypothetical protein
MLFPSTSNMKSLGLGTRLSKCIGSGCTDAADANDGIGLNNRLRVHRAMNQDWLRSGPSIADLHAIKRRSFLDIICPTHTRFNLTDELHGSLDTISLRAKRYQLCLSQTSLPTSKAVVLLLLTETKGSFSPSFLIVSKERIQRDVRGTERPHTAITHYSTSQLDSFADHCANQSCNNFQYSLLQTDNGWTVYWILDDR